MNNYCLWFKWYSEDKDYMIIEDIETDKIYLVELDFYGNVKIKNFSRFDGAPLHDSLEEMSKTYSSTFALVYYDKALVEDIHEDIDFYFNDMIGYKEEFKKEFLESTNKD